MMPHRVASRSVNLHRRHRPCHLCLLMNYGMRSYIRSFLWTPDKAFSLLLASPSIIKSWVSWFYLFWDISLSLCAQFFIKGQPFPSSVGSGNDLARVVNNHIRWKASCKLNLGACSSRSIGGDYIFKVE